ncbi:hypothetical protein HDV02_006532 [Globomyces sp. JEL0801]|nr:hypothetical protein HDV02_006532 [Globomyces sp. JEL0801]
MEAANLIRQNAKEQRDAMADLMDWSKKMESKDQVHSNSKSHTISTPSTINKIKKNPIKSFEYSKWDAFDVEKELDNIDYQPESVVPKKEELKPIINMEESLVQKELGNAYFKKQKFRKAIVCYSKSIEADPTSPIPLINRSFAYLKTFQYDLAEVDATLALTLDPKNIKALWRRGLARTELKNYSGAKKVCYFEDALVLEPTNSTIKSDLENLESKIKEKIQLEVDAQPLIKEAQTKRPRRKRLEIVDVNEPKAIANAAEATTNNKQPQKSTTYETQQNDDITDLSKNVTEDSLPEPSIVGDKETLVIDTPLKIETNVKVQKSTEIPMVPKPLPVRKIETSSTIKTLYDFERYWKYIKTDKNAQFEFLKSFEPEHLLRIFKQSFELHYLKSVLDVINEYYLEQSMNDQAIQLLETLSKIPRFGMVILFCGKEEKLLLAAIFTKLQGVTQVDLKGLKKSYRIV